MVNAKIGKMLKTQSLRKFFDMPPTCLRLASDLRSAVEICIFADHGIRPINHGKKNEHPWYRPAG